MSTHAYIGIRHPEQSDLVQLRYIHTDGYPAWTIHAVRQIWATTAARDTRRLITLLLTNDWDCLNADTTAADKPSFIGGQPIPGVGTTIAVTDFATGRLLPPHPVTVAALTQTGDLDAQWIYLLDATADTIATHTGGGALVGTEPLAS
ncbi:hypothetical protein [Paractinoplanes durhamensis]|uniref:Uncharacterized protein n=1 Tax=Paractinoplanes durhamensis TaxID=113563 RepID=A0ABQ3Z0Q8_9ACTN|nr:hypothetical protein [Actinoplanes durhamensis]GIE03420.1 hypothetical protein Adu01nite_47700 [Actinoplanes durhamensis]